MLRDIYYQLKPFMPWRLRMALRRTLAKGKRDAWKDVWPINESAAKPPDGWPGWPNGKKFAFVLTHDVEGQSGHDKCLKLAQLEKRLGFRSSFNLVPEGEYVVSPELRAELVREGFEVGVHDLHHDGKLYKSRADFARNAAQINRYLKDWGAVGFRSGFMLHNLEWAHDIGAFYDGSTFDIDPFEPQPDGMGTIFPFWVPKDNEKGYVELPYALPQDSTLYLILQETSPDIWLKKLDWVAEHGGMALVNVHPDYVCFEGEQPSPRTYPAAFYEKLLLRVREKYGQSAWCCLPRELAAFAAPLKLPPPRKPKRICMISYSDYMEDTRVLRYAETLAERGDHVDMLALRPTPDVPERELVRGVNLFRIQPRYGKKERHPLSFLTRLVRFLFVTGTWIARQHAHERYDCIHVHNVPDFLVFAALWPKLIGTKVILDIHDIVPEFYANKFGIKSDSIIITMLKWMERMSARFADHVIMANHLWLEKYMTRTGATGKCTVFINNVDTDIFRPRPRVRNDGKVIMLFPGGLQRHQGLDIAIGAFCKILTEMPNAEFHIYGDGNMREAWVDLCQKLGLSEKIRFFNPLPVREIAEVMANADLGVVPKRADSFGNEAYSTKIMEFMSLGIPVVVSKTKIDQYYFNDSLVAFFESGDRDGLAEAALRVIRDSDLHRAMVARALDYAVQNSWQSRKVDYLKLVDSLCSSEQKRA
jgi:glycosyltransferase involved in cell wall biosynthesis/peptidoglycan/xylan/chitin deacetylase (PgdA/CDA1 family)